jgi:host factor-I protein
MSKKVFPHPQDEFLNRLRRERVPVTMNRIDGARISCVIESFDPHVILYRRTDLAEPPVELAYKGTTMTIVPPSSFRFSITVDDSSEEQSTRDGEPLQEPYLRALRERKMPVGIYLASRVRLDGVIVGIDKFTLFLHGMGRTQMVYKHAIASVVPSGVFELEQLEAAA